MKTHHLGAQLFGLLLAGAIVLAAAPGARPCGAVLGNDVTVTPSIDGQRALLIWGDGTLQVHVQLALRGDAADAVWLVPVGAVPEVSAGDPALFQALDDVSAPTVELDPIDAGSDGGCGDAAAGADAQNTARGELTAFGGQAGKYTYEVVVAPSEEDLVAHLAGVGFTVPQAWVPELAAYINDKKTIFVAAKLTDPLSADGAPLEPLVLTVDRPATGEMTYLAGVGRLSAGDVMPVTLYNLADRRYRVVNYGSVSLDALAERVRQKAADGESAPYASALDELTVESAGRLAITEFARDLRAIDGLPAAVAALVDDEVFYLTRITARPTAANLTDMLVSFAFEAPEEDGIASVPATSGASLGATLLLVVCGLAGWLALVRRRRDLEVAA